MSVLNIHPHPNKKNPVRLRLQIRELDVQEYFSFREFGSEAEAMKAAIKKRDSLLKIHRLRNQLGFRQVFNNDGFIKGLRFYVSSRGQRIIMGLFVRQEDQREQRIKERVVNPDNIDDVFSELLDDMLRIKKITFDAKDKAAIKKVRMNYLREFHRLYDLHSAPFERQKQVEAEMARLQPPTLFTKDGKIDGLALSVIRTREIIGMNLRATVDGKRQLLNQRIVKKDNFTVKFNDLVAILIEHLGLILSKEEEALLVRARQKYRREFNKLVKVWMIDA